MNKAIALVLLALLFITPMILAQEVVLTPEQEEAKQKLENAIWVIYDIFKYVATAAGALMIAFAGLKFMSSGDDPMARNQAKNWITYIVIGLILIWLAPVIAKALVFTWKKQ